MAHAYRAQAERSDSTRSDKARAESLARRQARAQRSANAAPLDIPRLMAELAGRA